MTHIPNNTVVGGVINIVHGQSQFDGSEAGTQMTAGFGNRSYQKIAQFLGDFRQCLYRQSPQLIGSSYFIEIFVNQCQLLKACKTKMPSKYQKKNTQIPETALSQKISLHHTG